jgi:hypothetical protein
METLQASFDHELRGDPMGEAHRDALRLDSDRTSRFAFNGTKVISDGGLLAYRELDEVLGPISTVDSELCDIRMEKNTEHGITALLRQSIYSRFSGYDDTYYAERLALDPTARRVAGSRTVEIEPHIMIL